MFKFFILFLFFSSDLYAEVKWVDETTKKQIEKKEIKKQNSEFLNKNTIKKKKKIKIFSKIDHFNTGTGKIITFDSYTSNIKNEIINKNIKQVVSKKDFIKNKHSKKIPSKIEVQNKNLNDQKLSKSSFKKVALNFKELMRETVSAQDAVFEAEKKIISEQKSKKVVEGDYIPHLDAEVEGEYHIFDNFREVKPVDEFDLNVTSNWKIFDFGRKNMKYSSSDLSIDLSKNNLNITLNSELARLYKIFNDLTHQSRKLNLINEYEKIVLILKDDIENRIKGGVGTILEKNQFDQTLITLNLRKMDANKLYQSAKTDYQLYFTYRFDENLLPKIEDFLTEIEIAINKVFEIKHLSPQEKKLKLEIEKAYLDRKIYQSEYYPDVSIGLKFRKYDIYDNDPDYEILGLMTSKFNLFDGFKRQYSADSKFEEIGGLNAKLRLTTIQKEQRIMRYEIEYDNLIKETQTEEENKIKIQNDFNIAKDMADLKTLTFGERIKFATDILTSELKILENYFQRYEILIDIMKLKGGFTKMFNLNTIRFKGNI